jgi:hypothetical protein
MGNHPNFDMIYGVPITELGTYDEETELYTFEFKGKTVEFSECDVPSMEDYDKEDWDDIFEDTPLELHYSSGDWSPEEADEYIVGVRVWRIAGSCDVTAEYIPDFKEQEEALNLLKSIRPEIEPRMIGIIEVS